MKIISVSNHTKNTFIRSGVQCIPIVLFSLTFIVAGYFSTIGVDPHHDGIMFKPAMDVANGNILFRDSFTQYNALTTFIQAGALFLFGKYLLTIKLLTALIYGLISILLYNILKKILPTLLVFFTLIFWIFMGPYFVWTFFPWSSVYALLFQLITLVLMIYFIEKKKEKYLVLSGVTISLTFWARQSVGLLLFGFLFFYFIYQYILKFISLSQMFHRILYILFGIIACSALFFIWLIFNHALYDWWLQTFRYAYFWSRFYGEEFTLSHVFFKSLLPFQFDHNFIYSTTIWIALPISSIILFFVYTFKRIRKITLIYTDTVLLCIFVGLSSWMQYYPIMDYRHCYWGGTPMFGILSLLVYQLVRNALALLYKKNTVKVSQMVACLILLVLFYPDISYRIREGIKKINARYVMTTFPSVLKGMRIPMQDSEFYIDMSNSLTTYLDTYPKRNVLNLSMDALYLTFDERIKNIHPFYINGAGFNYYIYPDYWDILEKYWKTNLPIMITSGQFIPLGYCKQVSSPEMFDTYIIVPCQE